MIRESRRPRDSPRFEGEHPLGRGFLARFEGVDTFKYVLVKLLVRFDSDMQVRSLLPVGTDSRGSCAPASSEFDL